jgi:hypothetical protein
LPLDKKTRLLKKTGFSSAFTPPQAGSALPLELQDIGAAVILSGALYAPVLVDGERGQSDGGSEHHCHPDEISGGQTHWAPPFSCLCVCRMKASICDTLRIPVNVTAHSG